MQTARVLMLFRHFAGISEDAPYRFLADQAIQSVTAQMRTNADAEDERLYYYAAAMANLQYRRMTAANSCSLTSAGSAAAQKAAVNQCGIAEEILKSCREQAAPLLKDDAFFFAAADVLSEGRSQCYSPNY
ncbi:MAG: hypothetical protein MJ071_05085 [Oscillospiraceae bacterium]|nr:hypothetical protein [Oscillospiraceae bacterium]